MNIGLTFLGILLFLSSVFMMMLILVQRGKGGGLTGALGGMGGQSAFGSKAGDVFTRITIVTAIVWITLCMITIAAYNPPPKDDLTKRELPSLENIEDEEGSMGMGGDAGESEDSVAEESMDTIDEELSGLLSDEDDDSIETDNGDESVEESSGPSLDEPTGSEDTSSTEEGDSSN